MKLYRDIVGMPAKARAQFFRTDERSYSFRTTSLFTHVPIPWSRGVEVTQPESGDPKRQRSSTHAEEPAPEAIAAPSSKPSERTTWTNCVMCRGQTSQQCTVCFVGLCQACFAPFHRRREIKSDV